MLLVVMGRLLKLLFPTTLALLLVLGLSHPVSGQPPSYPTIYVEAPHSVDVSTEFDIIISIRDIPDGWGMISLDIEFQWDPNDLEYIEGEFLGFGRPAWDGGCGDSGPGLGGGVGSGDPWPDDAEWFRVRFHCLRAGPTPILVSSTPNTISLVPLTDGGSYGVQLEPVTVTIYQGLAPVGGISTPINKLEILTPYLVLAGLIATVSVVIIKKRK